MFSVKLAFDPALDNSQVFIEGEKSFLKLKK